MFQAPAENSNKRPVVLPRRNPELPRAIGHRFPSKPPRLLFLGLIARHKLKQRQAAASLPAPSIALWRQAAFRVGPGPRSATNGKHDGARPARITRRRYSSAE